MSQWLQRIPYYSQIRSACSPCCAWMAALDQKLRRLPYYQEARSALVAHWRKGAVVAAAVFLTIAAVTFALPRKYYSEAKLLVKTGGWENTLDATGSTGQAVPFFEPRETEINSILEVLRGRAVAEGVVDLIGIDALLHGGPIPEVTSATKVSLSDYTPSRDPQRQEALAMLEKAMQIWVPKRSNAIGIRCEASSPQLAQAINAAYLAVYKQVHAEVNSTKGSYEFFTEQQQQLRNKWEKATAVLRDAKDQLGVSTLAGRRTTLESQLNDVQKTLLANAAEESAVQGRIASIRKALATTEKFTETARAENANAAADNMRGSLYALQIKQKELLARYTEAHPMVRDMNEQVASLEKLLAGEGRTRVQSTTALNPAWTQLETSLLSETTRLDSFAAANKQLAEQQATLQAQLRTLNNDEIHLTQLQQAADLAEKACLETSQRLEQARIQRKLAEERISNVNVFQEPSFVSKAIAPKRSLILALGLAVSAFCGAATIAGCYLLGPSVVTSLDDLAQSLQLPIVAKLPAGNPAFSFLNTFRWQSQTA